MAEIKASDTHVMCYFCMNKLVETDILTQVCPNCKSRINEKGRPLISSPYYYWRMNESGNTKDDERINKNIAIDQGFHYGRVTRLNYSIDSPDIEGNWIINPGESYIHTFQNDNILVHKYSMTRSPLELYNTSSTDLIRKEVKEILENSAHTPYILYIKLRKVDEGLPEHVILVEDKFLDAPYGNTFGKNLLLDILHNNNFFPVNIKFHKKMVVFKIANDYYNEISLALFGKSNNISLGERIPHIHVNMHRSESELKSDMERLLRFDNILELHQFIPTIRDPKQIYLSKNRMDLTLADKLSESIDISAYQLDDTISVESSEEQPVSSKKEIPPASMGVSIDRPVSPVSPKKEIPPASMGVSIDRPVSPVSPKKETPPANMGVSIDRPVSPVSPKKETPPASMGVLIDRPVSPVSPKKETPPASMGVSIDRPVSPVSPKKEKPPASMGVSIDRPVSPVSPKKEESSQSMGYFIKESDSPFEDSGSDKASVDISEWSVNTENDFSQEDTDISTPLHDFWGKFNKSIKNPYATYDRYDYYFSATDTESNESDVDDTILTPVHDLWKTSNKNKHDNSESDEDDDDISVYDELGDIDIPENSSTSKTDDDASSKSSKKSKRGRDKYGKFVSLTKSSKKRKSKKKSKTKHSSVKNEDETEKKKPKKKSGRRRDSKGKFVAESPKKVKRKSSKRKSKSKERKRDNKGRFVSE